MQPEKQHKNETLLQPKVFNPNSLNVQIFTMRINDLMSNMGETI
jgi:hypothetical protein